MQDRADRGAAAPTCLALPKRRKTEWSRECVTSELEIETSRKN